MLGYITVNSTITYAIVSVTLTIFFQVSYIKATKIYPVLNTQLFSKILNFAILIFGLFISFACQYCTGYGYSLLYAEDDTPPPTPQPVSQPIPTIDDGPTQEEKEKALREQIGLILPGSNYLQPVDPITFPSAYHADPGTLPSKYHTDELFLAKNEHTRSAPSKYHADGLILAKNERSAPRCNL